MTRTRAAALALLAASLAACGAQGDPSGEADGASHADGVETPTVAAGLASTERCNCGLAALVAVNTTDGKLYRWTRPTPTSGSLSAAAKVADWGAGARLVALDASTGDLFVVGRFGFLYRFAWSGTGYTNQEFLAWGFFGARQLVAAGYGVLYAVDADGNISWWRWLGSRWAPGSGRRIGRWAGTDIFGGGDGILYGISRRTGDLSWYRHVAPQNGYASWRGPRVVAHGWGTLRDAVGLGGGVIYAVDAQGRLLSYQHLDLVEGGAFWANDGVGQQIGSGWQGYDRIAASPNACPTFPQNCMSQGNGLICGAGGDPNTLYRTYQGVVSPIRYCANGCEPMDARGTVWQDQCASAPGKISVAIQAGHENTIANCRERLVSHPGAIGEAAWTVDIARRVVAQLVAEGIDARAVDANFNCDPLATQHFDAVVAIHYQGASSIPGHGGYFVDTVDASYDQASANSEALVASLDFYLDQIGIAPGLLPNVGTIRQYYLKNGDLLAHPDLQGFVLSQDTPFALIEAGEGAPGGEQHDFLWNNRDLVASAITDGVMAVVQRGR